MARITRRCGSSLRTRSRWSAGACARACACPRGLHAGGRVGVASPADRAAPETTIRCALLNANGVFSREGELSPSWHPLASALAHTGTDVLLLTEPHMREESSLPADSPLQLVASPPPARRSGRRDAAVACPASCVRLWVPLPGTDVDITGAACRVGGPAQVVHFVSAYLPDTSRGAAARADFCDRLDSALRRWRAVNSGAILVIGLDANMWCHQLDPSRRESGDLPRLMCVFECHGLSAVNTPSIATHRSGTVVDWVVTSHPSLVSRVEVHGVSCHGSCRLAPACYPALGSDHMLISFELSVCAHACGDALPHLGAPRLMACDWASALHSARRKIEEVSEMLESSRALRGHSVRQITMDAIAAGLYECVWHAAESQGAVRRSSPRRNARRGCRWWTPACQAAWRRRQQAHAAFRAAPSPDHREELRLARNAFGHVVARAQREGWASLLGGIEGAAALNMRAAARTVRNECVSRCRGPPANMRRGDEVLDEPTSRHAWVEHFRDQSPASPPAWAGRLERVVDSWRTQRPQLAVSNVSVDELRAAACGAARSLGGAPGIDGLPYMPFLCRVEPWEKLLCSVFSMALSWGVVPRLWTLGVVVPLHKDGDATSFDNWRPITLLSSLGKLFEHVVLRRVAPQLLPSLAPSQAGFRAGADEQAFSLVEALRLRVASRGPRGRRPRPLVAFVDLRKAFDTVWRAGLLWKLRARGVRQSEWFAIEALLSNTWSRVRLPAGTSPPWEGDAGVRQGSVLSPLLFLIFIDDLAQELSVVPGVSLPTCSLSSLLYADDIAILADDEAALQRALDIVGAWASRWRMTIGTGPRKTAVMRFLHGPQEGMSPFVLAGRRLPWVSEYKYLGVTIDRGLTLQRHVAVRGALARSALFSCCGWAARERLPLATLLRLFECFVLPKLMWGMENVALSPARCRELDAWQRRLGRWLLRDFRAPDAAVLGDLGWRPWSSHAVERASALVARLLASPLDRPSASVVHDSLHSTSGWAFAVLGALRAAGAPLPPDVAPRLGDVDRQAFVRSNVRPRLAAADARAWRQQLAGYADPGLQFYACVVQSPSLAAAHRAACPPRYAAAWCRLRHGGSTLPVHRGARHRGASGCPLCGSAEGSLPHALFACSGLHGARARWWSRVSESAPAELASACPVSRRALLRWFFAETPCVGAHAAFAYQVECAYGRAR